MIDKYKLYFGLPIQLDEKTTLYQPTLKEILISGITLEKMLEPFVSLDKRNFKNELNNDKIKNFDMFFVQIFTIYANKFKNSEKEKDVPTIEEWVEEKFSTNNKEPNEFVLQRLIKVLKFLFKTDDVKFIMADKILENLEENYILINKSYKIDRMSYDNIKDLVCEIFDTQIEIKEDKGQEKDSVTKELDDKFAKKIKEYEEKYGKKVDKEKNRDRIDIFTLVNYIIHSKISQYDYNSVQDLTIYQIKNTFKYYQSQEAYDIDMKYRTSGNFKIEKNQEHWFFDK